MQNAKNILMLSFVVFVWSAVYVAAAQPIARKDFKAAIIGKTTAEVIKAVGRPNDTHGDEKMSWWHYDKSTYDPITGHTDLQAVVIFKGDVVVSVDFYGGDK